MANNCYLDANICISFIQTSHPFHDKAVKLIQHIRTVNLIPTLSPLCLDETIHILLRDGRQQNISNYLSVTKAEISKLLQMPNLAIVNPPSDPKSQLKIFQLIKKFDLKARDAYHLLTMKHRHIKHFATFDSDFDLIFSSRTLNRFTPTAIHH